MSSDVQQAGAVPPGAAGSVERYRSQAIAAALLRLCRLYYALPLGGTLALTIVYARDAHMHGEWAGMLAASASLALVVAAGYVFNDACDRRSDRINAPNRPVAAGLVSTRLACLWAGWLVAAGLAIAATGCRPAFTGLLAAVALGLFAYDLSSKYIGVGKQLLVAVLMTSIYPLALAQAACLSGLDMAEFFPSRPATLLFFPIWMFLTAFGYETLKDIRDLHGDATMSARPNWIARCPRRARRIASLATMLGAAALALPAWAGCGSIYGWIIPAAMLAAVISTRLPLRAALGVLYVEYVLVGVAATADLWS